MSMTLRAHKRAAMEEGIQSMIEFTLGLAVLYIFALTDNFTVTPLYAICIALLVAYQFFKNLPRILELSIEIAREYQKHKAAQRRRENISSIKNKKEIR